VDIDSYWDKDWVHPKCDESGWARTHLHHTSILLKQSYFQKQNILGYKHRPSLKMVFQITSLVLVLERYKQDYWHQTKVTKASSWLGLQMLDPTYLYYFMGKKLRGTWWLIPKD
jgi:hypothetical protein